MGKRRKVRYKQRDMGLLRKGRNLAAVDNGPLGRALGKKITELREAAGLSLEQLAHHIGATPRHMEWMESGKSMPTQECAYRIYRVIFGRETWRDAPNLRGIGDKVPPGYTVRVEFYDEELLKRWETFAATTGCTMSAVARYALERLFDHEPTLVTIKEGIEIAEKLRAQSLLENCSEYVTILRGDPLAAKLIAMKAQGWRAVGDESKALAIEALKTITPEGADGPATPVEHLREPQRVKL